jgi:prepilin-type N-terminal cleavage/methylation domain-containing protein
MTNVARSSRRRSRRRRAGFTLVEVLATMVMLGIVLPVAMRGVSIALATASSARHRAEAAELASAKLDELVTTGEWSASAPSGDFGTDYPGYTWTIQMASRDYGVTEILLTVTWQERGQPRTLNLATMVSDVNTAGQQTGMNTPPKFDIGWSSEAVILTVLAKDSTGGERPSRSWPDPSPEYRLRMTRGGGVA